MPSALPDHFSEFFGQYPEFAWNPDASITDEFYRMCDQFDWSSKNPKNHRNPEREAAKALFDNAMVQTFNDLYGTNAESRKSWHRLCVVLRIAPLPRGLKACREAVLRKHVNLVDLVDSGGKEVRTFETLKDLREYTRQGKYFPRENAYAGGLLSYLLREIDGEYHGRRKVNGGKVKGAQKRRGHGRGGKRRGKGRA